MINRAAGGPCKMAAIGTHGVFVNNRSPQTYGLHWGGGFMRVLKGMAPTSIVGCWASQ